MIKAVVATYTRLVFVSVKTQQRVGEQNKVHAAQTQVLTLVSRALQEMTALSLSIYLWILT